jgi:hypothetical protein
MAPVEQENKKMKSVWVFLLGASVSSSMLKNWEKQFSVFFRSNFRYRRAGVWLAARESVEYGNAPPLVFAAPFSRTVGSVAWMLAG